MTERSDELWANWTPRLSWVRIACCLLCSFVAACLSIGSLLFVSVCDWGSGEGGLKCNHTIICHPQQKCLGWKGRGFMEDDPFYRITEKGFPNWFHVVYQWYKIPVLLTSIATNSILFVGWGWETGRAYHVAVLLAVWTVFKPLAVLVKLERGGGEGGEAGAGGRLVFSSDVVEELIYSKMGRQADQPLLASR